MKNFTERPLEEVAAEWRERIACLRADIEKGFHLWRYLDMVRQHSDQQRSVNWYKATAFFALPLLLRARRIVEIGASFSVFPATYGSPANPWGPAGEPDEGVVSTRLLLAAAHLLGQAGIDARVTSIDVRESSNYANVEHLFASLGLREYWDPRMSTDSIDWLTAEKRRLDEGHVTPIDFALVDGHHTYDQVARELAGLLPVMAAEGAILIDDCYRSDFQVAAGWMPDETEHGLRRGGEFGAIVEFLERHQEWKAHWMPFQVLLSRTLGLNGPAPGVRVSAARVDDELWSEQRPGVIPMATASWIRQHVDQRHSVTVSAAQAVCTCGSVRAFHAPPPEGGVSRI
jgi:hypothetical protein